MVTNTIGKRSQGLFYSPKLECTGIMNGTCGLGMRLKDSKCSFGHDMKKSLSQRKLGSANLKTFRMQPFYRGTATF